MKKKTLKKILSLALVSTLAAGLLAGCGTEKETTESPAKESSTVKESSTEKESSTASEPEAYEYKTGITLTLSGRQGATDDWAATDMIQKLQEDFGVTIDCQPIADDAWATKFSLALAEDDLADFYTSVGFTLAGASENGADGYFLPINEYLDHMPNLKAFMEENPDYERACTSPDGNIYTLMQYTENPFETTPRAYIRKDWLENLGLDYPKTIDDLYKVLVAFKEKDANGNGDPNDEIPLVHASSYSRTALHGILPAFDIIPNSNTAKPYFITEVDDSGKVYLADVTDNYKAYLTFMHKLWEEELLYQEAFTVKIAEVRELVKANTVGIFADAAPYVSFGDATMDQYFTWFAGFTSEYNDKAQVGVSPKIGTSGKIAISASTEYPAEICRIIDWFYSEEGRVYGQDGDIDLYNVEYEEVVIPGYENYPIKNIVSDVPAGYDTWETHRHKKRVINDSFNIFKGVQEGSGYYAILNGSQKDEDLAQFGVTGIGSVGWAAAQQMRFDEVELIGGYPALLYEDDVVDERATLTADLKLYAETASTQFITGELDIEKDWDTFVATMNQMGLPRLLEIEQEAYDAMYK